MKNIYIKRDYRKLNYKQIELYPILYKINYTFYELDILNIKIYNVFYSSLLRLNSNNLLLG